MLTNCSTALAVSSAMLMGAAFVYGALTLLTWWRFKQVWARTDNLMKDLIEMNRCTEQQLNKAMAERDAWKANAQHWKEIAEGPL